MEGSGSSSSQVIAQIGLAEEPPLGFPQPSHLAVSLMNLSVLTPI